jgi:hypothetical protein
MTHHEPTHAGGSSEEQDSGDLRRQLESLDALLREDSKRQEPAPPAGKPIPPAAQPIPPAEQPTPPVARPSPPPSPTLPPPMPPAAPAASAGAQDPAPEPPAPAPPAPEPQPPLENEEPADLASRLWGSNVSLPASARAAAPRPAEPLPPVMPEPVSPPTRATGRELRSLERRLEDQLRDHEAEIGRVAQATRVAVEKLAERVETTTADLRTRVETTGAQLRASIEDLVERRLGSVGDALLKVAEARSRLQEETGQAVGSLRTSMRSLEDRVARSVQPSREGDGALVKAITDRVDGAVGAASQRIDAVGQRVERVERRLAEPQPAPGRDEIAAIRSAVSGLASSLRTELTEAVQGAVGSQRATQERIGALEGALASRVGVLEQRLAQVLAQSFEGFEQRLTRTLDEVSEATRIRVAALIDELSRSVQELRTRIGS